MALEETKLPDIVLDIEPTLWIGKCCIYRVPENLRKEKPEAYTPQRISIGPIHHNEPKLLPMENEKERYYREFFRRRLGISSQEALDRLDLGNFLLEMVPRIKHCYSEKYDGDNKDNAATVKFVKMILLDAIFIIELFLRNCERHNYRGDHLFALLFLQVGIKRDLLLLENQLPFFVFKELYNKLNPQVRTSGNPSFLDVAHKYFRDIDQSISWLGDAIPSWLLEQQNDFKHFTHLIRCYYIPPDFANQRDRRRSIGVGQIRATRVTRPSNSYNGHPADRILKSATKLNNAGVSFRQLSNKFLLDISFQKNNMLNLFPCMSCLPYVKCVKARFQIPQLTVDDGTECILRNLIAFEQCQYPCEAYICNYVSLFDYLIDTKEDVELLVDRKVITHELGSNDDVATLFNNLGKEVITYWNRDCYGHLIVELNNHYNNKWNHAMATLRSVYFCDLWRGSSTVVGIAVLFFTFFNFFSSIF